MGQGSDSGAIAKSQILVAGRVGDGDIDGGAADAGVPEPSAAVAPDAGTPPVPATDAGTNVAAPCDPIALPRDQYLRQPGTSSADFGYTTMSGTAKIPALGGRRARGGIALEETDAAPPPITSVYTQAGWSDEGVFIGNEDDECGRGRFPMRWTITPGGAERLRAGEQEHCADYLHAFAISLQRYARVVNELARSGRVFRNLAAARRFVTAQVGAAPETWSATFQRLAHKSDERDARRWHRPRVLVIKPRIEQHCAFAEYRIGGGSLPEVGTHPTDELVRDDTQGPQVPERGQRPPATRRRNRK